MNSPNYWKYIRVFHILLGALLLYIGIQHFRGIKTPKSFYYLIIVLGSGAVVYHGYKLLTLLGMMN